RGGVAAGPAAPADPGGRAALPARRAAVLPAGGGCAALGDGGGRVRAGRLFRRVRRAVDDDHAAGDPAGVAVAGEFVRCAGLVDVRPDRADAGGPGGGAAGGGERAAGLRRPGAGGHLRGATLPRRAQPARPGPAGARVGLRVQATISVTTTPAQLPATQMRTGTRETPASAGAPATRPSGPMVTPVGSASWVVPVNVAGTPAGPPLIWMFPYNSSPALPRKVSEAGAHGTLRSTTSVTRSSVHSWPRQTWTGAA